MNGFCKYQFLFITFDTCCIIGLDRLSIDFISFTEGMVNTGNAGMVTGGSFTCSCFNLFIAGSSVPLIRVPVAPKGETGGSGDVTGKG